MVAGYPHRETAVVIRIRRLVNLRLQIVCSELRAKVIANVPLISRIDAGAAKITLVRSAEQHSEPRLEIAQEEVHRRGQLGISEVKKIVHTNDPALTDQMRRGVEVLGSEVTRVVAVDMAPAKRAWRLPEHGLSQEVT